MSRVVGCRSDCRRKHDVTCLVTPDVVGVGLRSDNHFFSANYKLKLSLTAMLGNEIVDGVTFLRYGGNQRDFENHNLAL